MSAYFTWLACWVPVLGVLVGARWATGRLVRARPALWPREAAWWKRVAVAVGGSAVCMVGVVVVVFVSNVMDGTRQTDGMVLVADVTPGSPSDIARLRLGDRIAAVDGHAVHDPLMLAAQIEQASGPVTLEIHDSDGNIGFSTVVPVEHGIGIDMERSLTARPGWALAWRGARYAPVGMALTFLPGEPSLTWEPPWGPRRELSVHSRYRLRRLDFVAYDLLAAAFLGQIIALVLLAIPRRSRGGEAS